MPEKITKDDGTEIEVYTAEEVQTQKDEAIKAKEEEFGKTKAEIEAERDEARKALGERNSEFKQFRKLSEDQVAKLSIAEKALYDNQLVMEDMRKAAEDTAKTSQELAVANAIKARAGGDEKLIKKLTDTYAVIGIQANTPEEINNKITMALGAIGTTEPDLLASLGGYNGVALPPNQKSTNEPSFAETERGKAGAAELGLKI